MGADRKVFAGTALLTMLFFQSAPATAQQRAYSVSGAANVDGTTGLDNPYTLLGRPDVQAIATEALNGPITADRLATLLLHSEVKLENLVRTDVLEPTGDGRYKLATTVLTAEDRLLINQASDPLGRSLAEALLKERAGFDRILARYDLPRVDPAMVRMALIGCVILDWDGLGVTADDGYRTPASRRPNGARYQMVLRENAANISVHALYWGSSNNQVADKTIWMTTFGDHHSGSKRLGFPDLAGIIGGGDFEDSLSLAPSRSTREAIAAELEKSLSGKLTEMQEIAGPVMIALRNGPADASSLASATNVPVERVTATLDLLQALRYVEREGDRYRAAIPVFTYARDAEMILAYRQLGKSVMRRWLRANYADVQRQFSGLASVRAGVPFKTMFTELWHPIFGWANYYLVKREYLLDPYGPTSPFISFVPFVWDASLKMNEGTRIVD